MNIIEIAKRNLADAEVGLIEEAMSLYPELTDGEARTVNGTGYDTLVRTALGAVAFRNANEGTARTEDTYENRRYTTFIMDPVWFVDKAVADRSEDGWQALLADMAAGKLEAASQAMSSQFYYGVDNDSKGYPGLQAQVDSGLLVDLSGSGSTCTTIWAVKWGPRYLRWILGANGLFEARAPELVTKQDGDGNDFRAYEAGMTYYPGLALENAYAIGAIQNIDSTHKCDDDDVAALLELMAEKGVRPDVLYMHPIAQEYIREARTATNATGAPAPLPMDVHGIPIHPTLGIVKTETNW